MHGGVMSIPLWGWISEYCHITQSQRGGGAYDCMNIFPDTQIYISEKEHKPMRFFYGRQPKITKQDAGTFSGKGYQCDTLLQTKDGQPVVIAHSAETDVWKVAHGFSAVYFGTYAEALAYCRGRFFDLDGKQV